MNRKNMQSIGPGCIDVHHGGHRTRRDMLKQGLIAAGSVFASAHLPSARAQLIRTIPPPPNPDFPRVPSWQTELRELAPNVYAYIQGGGPDESNVGVSNALAIVGDEYIFLVDALAAPLHAKAMVAALREVTDNPFRYVVTTHFHPDHFFGNQFIPDNPEIIAHPYTRDSMLPFVDGPEFWERREGWAVGDEPRDVLLPTATIDGNATFYVGDTTVEVLNMGWVHTYGDLAVYLPKEKVLALGDIAFFYVAPFLQSGDPAEWLRTCERINDMDVEYIVPGHGPLGGKRELAEMADYIRLLRAETRKRFDAGMTPGAAAADITLGKYDNWIGPERIVMNVSRFYLEFSGTLSPEIDFDGLVAATEEYNELMRLRTAQ